MLNSNKEIQIFLTGGISYKVLIYKVIKFNLMLIIIFQILLEIISPLSIKLANNIKNEKMEISKSIEDESYWKKKNNQLIYFDLTENETI